MHGQTDRQTDITKDNTCFTTVGMQVIVINGFIITHTHTYYYNDTIWI